VFDSEEPGSRIIHGNSLDQLLFLQSVKFAQLSDQTIEEFIADPASTVEDSPETVSRVAVRTAVLNCAVEVSTPVEIPANPSTFETHMLKYGYIR